MHPPSRLIKTWVADYELIPKYLDLDLITYVARRAAHWASSAAYLQCSTAISQTLEALDTQSPELSK